MPSTVTEASSPLPMSSFFACDIWPVRSARYPSDANETIDAASSWMMSGAVPPANCVVSLSLIESQLAWTTCTWMSGLAAFQLSTTFFVAAMVAGWSDRDWKVSVTGVPAGVDAPAAPEAVAPPVVAALPPPLEQPARASTATAAATSGMR